MFPEAGSEVVAPAVSTPGKFASFGMSCSKKRAADSLSGNCASGNPTRKVRVLRRIHPDVCLLQIHEAPHHQARADQQNQSQRHFRDDERVAHALTFRAAAAGAPAFFESIDQMRMRGLERRQQAKENTRNCAYAEREGENPPIKIEVDPVWHLVRKRRHHQVHAPDGEDQTKRAAHHAEHQAFGQKLAHDLAAGSRPEQAESRSPWRGWRHAPEEGSRHWRRR